MSFQKLKNAWENRPRFFSDMDEDKKMGSSILAGPVFIPLHALYEFEDFRNHWRQEVDSPFLNGALAACMLLNYGALASSLDDRYTGNFHNEKILTSVSELSCTAPKVNTEVICGTKEIPSTSYFSPFKNDIPPSVVMVRARNVIEDGTLGGDFAQSACKVLQYTVVPSDSAFIRDRTFEREAIEISVDCRPIIN